MNNRKAIWLAVSLCGLVIVEVFIGLFHALQDPVITGSAVRLANQMGNLAFTIAFAIVGALIVSRQPGNTIGWLLMVIALSISFFALIPSQASVEQQFNPQVQPSFTVWLFAWANNWSWWGLIGPLLLIPLLFPNGRLLSPRWRWVVVALGLCFAVFLLVSTFSVGITTSDQTVTIPNPIGFLPMDVMDMLLLPFEGLLVSTAILSVVSLFVRYHRSSNVQREKIKWMVYACAIFIVLYVLGFLGNFSDTDIFGTIFNLGIMAIPVAIGIAILRSHLFDIDVIIRRTVSYALLAVLLAVVYFGSVILLQQIFASATGQRSEVITVLSTLAIAAVFVPLRNRIQRTIDQRFNRKKYNAQQVLNDFATTVRDETDLEKLTGRLVGVVNETMQPKSVSLWLHPAREPRNRES